MPVRHHNRKVTPGQIVALGLFIGGLVFCIAGGHSLLWALGFGVLCFSAHARSVGIPFPEIVRLIARGVSRIANILVIFMLIGMLTGVWRLSGTIPFLIDWALSFIDPTFFILWCFLLCAGLSTLIGTAFGTVSTLGVICMLMGQTAGFNELYVGGAILSGVYVGDRCSPMSSSAALVCALTHTDIYGNFKRLLRDGFIPFMLVCAGYAVLSLLEPMHEVDASATAALRENFRFGIWAAVPALIVLFLGAFRVNVKIAMALSIAFASGVAVFMQGTDIPTLLRSMTLGYAAPHEGLAMLAGGGIASMANVTGIVAISSSYSALFEKSGLLDSFEGAVVWLARRIGSFRATALVGLFSTGLACNQTLSIIITHQLCSHVQSNRREMAMYLENSVVILSAVLPWSIAFSMVSLTLQQSAAIIPFALYLWMVPLYWCVRSRRAHQY
ncbi:MAG: sodium:proton antiporter [Mailhella sp.]|nr:sodium:proton antiporter [Mailhella sp.]